jgi:hypothetical protein
VTPEEVIEMTEPKLRLHPLLRDLWELHESLVRRSDRLSRAVESQAELLDDEDYGRIRGRQHAFEDTARDLRAVLDRFAIAASRDEATVVHGPAVEDADTARSIVRLLRRSAADRRQGGWSHGDMN